MIGPASIRQSQGLLKRPGSFWVVGNQLEETKIGMPRVGGQRSHKILHWERYSACLRRFLRGYTEPVRAPARCCVASEIPHSTGARQTAPVSLGPMTKMLDKDRRPVLPGDTCIATDAIGNVCVGTALEECAGWILIQLDREDGELVQGVFPPHRVQAIGSSEPVSKGQVQSSSATILDFPKK